jgi:hypothetical protein
MKLAKTYTITTRVVDLAQPVTFAPSDFVMPDGSGFQHQAFWNEFQANHNVNTEIYMLDLLIDISRCHFSPKVSRWPGMKVTVTYHTGGASTTKQFIYREGVSNVTPFLVNAPGKDWTWTRACLATAGLYREIYLTTPEGKNGVANIPGVSKGYTQYCGTLKGWTVALQEAAEQDFDTWIKTNAPTKVARDPDRVAKILKAARTTIKERSDTNCALGVKNILRLLNGDALVVAENPSYLFLT